LILHDISSKSGAHERSAAVHWWWLTFVTSGWRQVWGVAHDDAMIAFIHVLSFALLLQTTPGAPASQAPPPRPKVLFDLSHAQTYFSAEPGRETAAQRAYGVIADSLGIELAVTGQRLSPTSLAGVQTVVIVAPAQPLDDAEVKSVVDFVNAGGSLLLVMDEERRQNLARSRVNDMIRPFGLTLTADTPYLHNRGAVARAGRINAADRELPYSGGRAVEGGTPFSLMLEADGRPSTLAHAAWLETPSGGRIVVMGDAMVVILLGQPEGVRLGGGLRQGDTLYWGRDSRLFMTEVVSWLTNRIR
jgi:hypothetical protein